MCANGKCDCLCMSNMGCLLVHLLIGTKPFRTPSLWWSNQYLALLWHVSRYCFQVWNGDVLWLCSEKTLLGLHSSCYRLSRGTGFWVSVMKYGKTFNFYLQTKQTRACKIIIMCAKCDSRSCTFDNTCKKDCLLVCHWSKVSHLFHVSSTVFMTNFNWSLKLRNQIEIKFIKKKEE